MFILYDFSLENVCLVVQAVANLTLGVHDMPGMSSLTVLQAHSRYIKAPLTKFDVLYPGVVIVKETSTSAERQVSILHVNVEDIRQADTPEIIPPGGASSDHLDYMYLYTQIAPIV